MVDFHHKTVLITGGAGFIGSNLAFYFQENFPTCKVVVFDCFRSEATFSNGHLKSFGHFKNLIGFQGEVISGDINDEAAIAKLVAYRFDYIFHEAAISDTTVLDQGMMIQTNVNAFKHILELAHQSGAVIVYASSAATYGDAPSPQRIGYERPQNVYGFSKLAMEHTARAFCVLHPKMSVVGLWYFNVYGPREYFKHKTASMALQLGLQILSGNKPRLFYGSEAIQRDFIYIDDVIQANLKAALCGKCGVYNVGTGNPRSFQEIADTLQQELGTSLGTDYFENPYVGAYQMHTQADIALTCQDLGYRPSVSLEEGIKAYAPEIQRIYESEVKRG
ncbi:ADP-glyceromanno-heptose 6-epimerase [Sulfurospirillum sp. MES]|uniref:ADP-glyceromanno-heptose 6-epimerase n=1 Tax=Sulfurospirillum sp. MES TaxID=1565314 RepID=UPI000AB3260C|nr:ADP-glyceromanno-heptose 6-epimerase [Sulfurospirillum sp. MES]